MAESGERRVDPTSQAQAETSALTPTQHSLNISAQQMDEVMEFERAADDVVNGLRVELRDYTDRVQREATNRVLDAARSMPTVAGSVPAFAPTRSSDDILQIIQAAQAPILRMLDDMNCRLNSIHGCSDQGTLIAGLPAMPSPPIVSAPNVYATARYTNWHMRNFGGQWCSLLALRIAIDTASVTSFNDRASRIQLLYTFQMLPRVQVVDEFSRFPGSNFYFEMGSTLGMTVRHGT
uniref:SUN domain-containing protein n=1 Tax=Glossina morsitans morsitans TaxID=37546 RepID=A0ABK9NGA6_GLOMM